MRLAQSPHLAHVTTYRMTLNTHCAIKSPAGNRGLQKTFPQANVILNGSTNDLQ